ncbi:hypothetical protein QZR14_22990 [Pseudomonas sp. rhizo66]|jgi:hypothetical protein|uniref:hypothetical protein n=1 Tax=Pseudomonas sp. rhizo66 TaxID=3059674 RepID=UPI002891E2E3|nr:hypothetical protein [Pseudomonas sp. rhizo66]MDT3314238.1 hypothetical protein [Pseudomonas sp. rhizo66]
MTTTVMQPKGTWASLTLAAAIATVCVGIAYEHDMLGPKPPQPLNASIDEESLKVQLLADTINKKLAELTTALEKYTLILTHNDAPESLFEINHFSLIADNLRCAERTLKNDKISADYKTESKSILRSIAKARSAASLNASIVNQRSAVPEYYESDVDMDALKALVVRSTDRLILSVS